MLVELVQVTRNQTGYGLSKIYLNPRHIVFISEDAKMKTLMRESSNLGLAPETTFSTIRINDGGLNREISVVGDPTMIESKIFRKKRQNVLRG